MFWKSTWGFSMRLVHAVLAAAAVVVLSGAAQANAPRVKAEDRVFAYDAQLPSCSDPGVISRIQGRFNGRETAYWNSTLQLTSVDRIRETNFRPNGQDLIPRRYCTGRALLSDGRYHSLSYNLVEDAGITGWHGSLFLGLVRFPTPSSYNVEWCISGLDRHRTYAPDCQMARP
jgi:hypothetical protein